jgi:hypothetical protein
LIRGSTRGKASITNQEGQCKDISCYYRSFKTRLGDQLGQGLGHRSRGLTWVDPSQCIYKSSYHHSFKKSKTRFRSWVRRVNLVNPKILMFYSKTSMDFWPMFYPKLTWVFNWTRSSQSFLNFFLNSNKFRP